MKPKGEGCWSITQAELLAELGRGSVLWLSKCGPHLSESGNYPHRELHPRQDTVGKLIASGALVESGHANEVQRSCGMRTYVLGKHPYFGMTEHRATVSAKDFIDGKMPSIVADAMKAKHMVTLTVEDK